MRKKNTNTKYVQLQTRGIPEDIRDRAEEVAQEQGFSSLQDAVRMFIKKLASKRVDFKLMTEEEWYITPEMEARYAKEIAAHMELEKQGKVKSYTSAAEMLRDLDAD